MRFFNFVHCAKSNEIIPPDFNQILNAVMGLYMNMITLLIYNKRCSLCLCFSSFQIIQWSRFLTSA